MPFKRSVSQLGFVDLEHRSAPRAFAKRPTSLREISAAGQELGIDVLFTPQYMWLAEEYLSAKLPAEWSQVFDQQHQAYYYYNSKTHETSWENPFQTYYSSQFQKQQRKDEEQGATVLGMATRRLSVIEKKKVPLIHHPLVLPRVPLYDQEQQSMLVVVVLLVVVAVVVVVVREQKRE